MALSGRPPRADQPVVAMAGAAVSRQDVLLATKLHVPLGGRVLCPARGCSPGRRRGWHESRSWSMPQPDPARLSCWPTGPARRPTGGLAVANLDIGDNDPARFWRHVVAALVQAFDGRLNVPGSGRNAAPAVPA